jgi:hypothetical protein
MSSMSRPLVKNLNTISASSRPGLSLNVRLGATRAKGLLLSAILFFCLKRAAGLMLGFTAAAAAAAAGLVVAGEGLPAGSTVGLPAGGVLGLV